MNVNSIRDGVVIDHIKAGRAMRLYELMKLDELDASVAIIQRVPSRKMGKKDIIKIDADVPVNLDLVGYVDPSATVNVIREEEVVEKRELTLPEVLTDVITCKNPRCITSVEQELAHVFTLSNPQERLYRCLYCETKADLLR